MKPSLKSDQVLVCAPDLDLHFDGQHFNLYAGVRSLVGGKHTLAILNVFAQPMPLDQAIAQLSGSIANKLAWIELMNAILALHNAGVLVDPAAISPPIGSTKGFDAAHVHIAMLNDRRRTESYLAAIRETVKPDDVVVDLGTGTGVLAIAAAQAGARHVYAIERGSIGDVAQQNFVANHVADRVTLIRGWSTQVSLPEAGDVLVSEIIGTDPLAERIVEYTTDAVKRLLKPDARLIPAKLDLYFQPYTLPDDVRQGFFFSPLRARDWQSWYGIDFTPLSQANAEQAFAVAFKAHKIQAWQSLCEPVRFAEIAFAAPTAPAAEWVQRFTVQRAGRLDSVIVYPEVHLSPALNLTRDPQQVDATNHWRIPVWLLPQPIDAQPGDTYEFSYRYSANHGRGELVVTPV